MYSGKSSREVGTLFHLKNYFEQRNVTGNVKESFNYNEDFLEFCTEGYVILLALHILGMDSLQDIPDAEDKLMCLHTTASKIIDRIFQSAILTVQSILRMGADYLDQQDTILTAYVRLNNQGLSWCSATIGIAQEECGFT